MAISAVLPLKASGSYDVNDLKRAHILFTSLQTFVAAGTISEDFRTGSGRRSRVGKTGICLLAIAEHQSDGGR